MIVTTDRLSAVTRPRRLRMSWVGAWRASRWRWTLWPRASPRRSSSSPSR